MTESKADGVKVVSPGGTYTGQQGFTYGAGASKETVGAGSICMNVLPMPSGARAKVHYHDRIETIAYMLEGECDVYYGDQLEHKVHLLKGDQIFIPGDVPHAPCNDGDQPCTWLVVHSSELVPT